MKTEHTKVLELFTSKDSAGKYEWLNKPFSREGVTAASNKHCMAIVPEQSDYEDRSEETKDFIPPLFPVEQWISIPVSAINEALEQIPLIPITESEECEACDGAGEVNWSFYFKGKAHFLDEECPLCEGSGEVSVRETGEKAYKSMHYVQLFDNAIDPKYLKSVVECADIMGSLSVNIAYSGAHKGGSVVFEIRGVQILMMAVYGAIDYGSSTIIKLSYVPIR